MPDFLVALALALGGAVAGHLLGMLVKFIKRCWDNRKTGAHRLSEFAAIILILAIGVLAADRDRRRK